MLYHKGEVENLRNHLNKMKNFLDLTHRITDLSERTSEDVLDRLTIILEQTDGQTILTELDPNVLDTYLIFKKVEEIAEARIEQLEQNLADAEQQMNGF